MELKPLLKEWRIWVLILALGISMAGLSPHYEQQDNGQVGIDTNIKEGLDLAGGTRVLLSVQGDNTSEAQVNKIKNILQQRVSAFGLTQTSVRTVRLGDQYNIQIEIASTNRTQLRELISQEGKFEARLPITVSDTQEFTLDETYTFERDGNGTVQVNDRTIEEGERFKLEDTIFYYVNDTEQEANLAVVAYNGSQIEQVLTSDSRVQQAGTGSYSFRFPVVITSEAAQNVRDVTSNYPTVSAGCGDPPCLGRLDSSGIARLNLVVDEELQNSLEMSAVFKQQVVTQPSITGGGATAAEAREDMKQLQAILQSGRLPAPVQIESISTISSSLGSQFMSAAILSIVASLIAVGFLIFLRYDDIRLVIPIVITGSSEVFILLGSFFSTFITLDLASIAGIIAAVGTGVDDQIIITDESGKEKIRDWKKRLKRAFFVIFTSAASTIGAMMPIVSPSLSNLAVGAAGVGLLGYSFYSRRTNPHYVLIGAIAVAVSAVAFQLNPSAFALQTVKGFAVTTILGVLVGITITRPAYAKVLEQMDK